MSLDRKKKKKKKRRQSSAQSSPQSHVGGASFISLNEPTALHFGFYSENEILKLSVKSISSASTFDSLGHPISGGLYDLDLGPTEFNHGACPTCGLTSTQCPGHLAHIKLVVPVYNPMTFGQLYKLLTLKCVNCHHFRMNEHTTRVFKVRLMLLAANMTIQSTGLNDELLARNANEEETDEARRERVSNILLKYEREASAILSLGLNEKKTIRGKSFIKANPYQQHTHTRMEWQKVVGEFLSSQPKKVCENCHSNVYKFRKDGNSRIFRMPLNEKLSMKNKMKGTMVQDAFSYKSPKPKTNGTHRTEVDEDSSDDDDEDDDEVNESAVPKNGTFMHATEIKEQLRLLWKNEVEILNFLWGKTKMSMNSIDTANTTPSDQDNTSLNGYNVFFMNLVPVPPPRFRPPTTLGDLTFEHPQNVALTKVINLNNRIRTRFLDTPDDAAPATPAKYVDNRSRIEAVLSDWISLQDTINGFLDSAKVTGMAAKSSPPGVRQLLEKKQGLFRQNMMGKRVNYAARSVISPDPYIGTDEVGVPVRFAKRLSYPEPVTPWNTKELAQMVRNGPEHHPGASYIEDEDGRLTDLRKRNRRQRNDLANRLESIYAVGLKEETISRSSKAFIDHSTGEGMFKAENNREHSVLSLRQQKKVWRHLRSGDVMLANRQPTLHKPSIMAHKVRVISNPHMQTIRLHYANCNTYNADFDGDEINLHFPQTELARAEAFQIAYTNMQYCSPTNGEPLRGLIQDHVGMGVMLTKPGTFLTKDEYIQMVYTSCAAMMNLDNQVNFSFKVLQPAILKPVQRWTGKQVITTVLMHLVGTEVEDDCLITLGPGKTKTPVKAWKVYHTPKVSSKRKKLREHALSLIGGVDGPLGETQVVVRQGVLCTGILDKAQFGASKHGLVHAVHEIYGATAAGELLSAFGRLFTFCTQKYGHTCAIEDLLLLRSAEANRTRLIQRSISKGVAVSAKFAGLEDELESDEDEDEEHHVNRQFKVARALQKRIRETDGGVPDEDEARLDNAMQAVTSEVISEIISESLPGGQYKPFPLNCFSLMVFSGAKGSLVNHSQVSCGLGQQALEGRRVPRMISGKSLPCFSAFDPTPRAGGYISDRFLTGIRPQEYYFHCMAGREGLVDTAVKTSRSGYLQRCLVKHLEGLSVGYDRTVRMEDGSVLQFLYGDDGVDSLESGYLYGNDATMGFLYKNMVPLCQKLQIGAGPGQLNISEDAGCDDGSIHIDSVRAHKKHLQITETSASLAVGSLVMARRRRETTADFSESNLKSGFERAMVKKVRASQDKHGSQLVDLVFESDGVKVKKMPVTVQRKVSAAGTVGPAVDKDAKPKRKAVRLQVPLVYQIQPEPVLWQLPPDNHLGSINEKLQLQIDDYVKRNPSKLLQGEDDSRVINQLLWVKYLRCLAAPGENVGTIAAQSIGEPSTQMTLNTFHLAGHGGANVTLGIPRLRELLMTASTSIKTPSMTLPLLPSTSKKEAHDMQAALSRVLLSSVLQPVNGIVVTETMKRRGVSADDDEPQAASDQWCRQYTIRMNLLPLKAVKAEFNLGLGKIGHVVGKQFAPLLLRLIAQELRRSGERISVVTSKEKDDDDEGDDEEPEPAAAPKKQKANPADSDLDSDDGDEAEDGNSGLKKKRKAVDYDEDEESEDGSAAADAASEDEESEEDDEVQLGLAELKRGTSSKVNKVAVANSVAKNNCFVDCYTYDHKEAYLDFIIQFPASTKKLLIVEMADAVIQKTVLTSVKGIDNCYLIDKGDDTARSLQTDGCNLPAVWSQSHLIDVNRLYANDVGAILRTYGVEAARASIVNEVNNVFGAYGIEVDNRHLGLVADYMTFEGGYRALNRIGIKGNTSPFCRMSYETSSNFLVDSSLFGDVETMNSPSARIALGQVVRHGTGCIDLLVPSVKEKQLKKKSLVKFLEAH